MNEVDAARDRAIPASIRRDDGGGGSRRRRPRRLHRLHRLHRRRRRRLRAVDDLVSCSTVPVQGRWEREPHRAPRTVPAGDCDCDLADGMSYGCTHTHIHVTQTLGKAHERKLKKKLRSLPEAPFPQSEQSAVVSVVAVVVSGPGVDPGR